MSATEVRATWSLASLFALRMLGLFIILPVFAVHARQLPGGADQTLVGAALGAYGLTQAFLHIPFGMASDRFGRKRVIVAGLALFALGSVLAAIAGSVWMVILGRAIQGLGAISAAVVAFAADLTREQHRTKAMAAIGGSIGLAFALSLVAAPAMYRAVGMAGIFLATGLLALAAIWVTLYIVPPEPPRQFDAASRVDFSLLGRVAGNRELARLNFGIFSLHLVQIAMFVVIPPLLVRGGLPLEDHWKLYLPVVLASFVLMLPPIYFAERRGRLRQVFLGAIALLVAVQCALAAAGGGLWALAGLLLAFFTGFNVLEAALPSLVSRIAPAAARGTAIGVYNTTQAAGLAVGGIAGGYLAQRAGFSAVFVGAAALLALWLLSAWRMRPVGVTGMRRVRLEGGCPDPVALRDRLLRVRGVREVQVMPEEDAVLLTVYSDNWDEAAALALLRAASPQAARQGTEPERNGG